MLPAADATSFMKVYVQYKGTTSEADVIKHANALLARKDVLAFLALPESFGKGGLDAQFVLCTVLSEATPAGLAAFAAQGTAQVATAEIAASDVMKACCIWDDSLSNII